MTKKGRKQASPTRSENNWDQLYSRIDFMDRTELGVLATAVFWSLYEIQQGRATWVLRSKTGATFLKRLHYMRDVCARNAVAPDTSGEARVLVEGLVRSMVDENYPPPRGRRLKSLHRDAQRLRDGSTTTTRPAHGPDRHAPDAPAGLPHDAADGGGPVVHHPEEG